MNASKKEKSFNYLIILDYIETIIKNLNKLLNCFDLTYLNLLSIQKTLDGQMEMIVSVSYLKILKKFKRPKYFQI